jgi:fructose-bisphosphate aldolase class II
MKTLRQIINENLRNQTAVGHFNFPNFEVAEAIVEAAKELNLPVILGLSEGERDYVGLHEAVSWVKAVNDDIEKENLTGKANLDKVKVFLNADHTYTFERVKEAVEAGFDMVIYDDAQGDIEKNVQVAKECRDFITEYNLANKKDVLFEAELGYIGKGSEVRSDLPDGIQKTNPEDAKRFVKKSEPDLLAPAIGNVHGMLKDIPEPNLDEKLCQEIFNAVKIPLVLHGASGNSKEDIQSCIKAGVSVVHVSTEIRVAFKHALVDAVKGEDLAAYKYLKPVREEVKKLIEEKLRIFNFL